MAVEQPEELIRFISGIPVAGDGTVPINVLEASTHFESDMYEPLYYLTVLARLTQQAVKNGKIKEMNRPVEDHTIVSKLLKSNLASYAPDIYLLTRIIVLECFSLVYHTEEAEEVHNLKYVSPKDIKNTKNNIRYVTDFLSTEDDYRYMIEPLRDLDVSLGYIQYQVDVIMNNKGERRW